jgi:hypothetical protein
MTTHVTECIFLYGARAIFSTQTRLRRNCLLLDSTSRQAPTHVDALLRFPRRLDFMTRPSAASQWLMLTQWQSLDGLSRRVVGHESEFEITTPRFAPTYSVSSSYSSSSSSLVKIHLEKFKARALKLKRGSIDPIAILAANLPLRTRRIGS